MLLRSSAEREQAYEIVPDPRRAAEAAGRACSRAASSRCSASRPRSRNPPAVFVADEPTLGLAPLAAEEVMPAARRAARPRVDDPARRGEGARGAGGGGHGRVHGARAGWSGWGHADQIDEERLAEHLPGDGNVTYRVIHWGTGNTGRLALRGVLQHPDLELVGLYVHNPGQGRHATPGELIGLRPCRRHRHQRCRRAARARRRLPVLPRRRHRAARPRGGRRDEPVPRSRAQCRHDVAQPAGVPQDRCAASCAIRSSPRARDGNTSFFNNGADPGLRQRPDPAHAARA